MKKFYLLTKTLLVAALLCVGANAWAETTTVGAEDNTTAFWGAFSDYYTVAPNGTLVVSFTNYTNKSANYHNWVAVVTTNADRAGGAQSTEGYYEYALLRPDNLAYRAGDYAGTNTYDGADKTWATLTSSLDWTDFPGDMDGSKVVMSISRNDKQVTIYADITTTSGARRWEKLVFECTSAEETLRFFLTVDHSHIENLAKSNAISIIGATDYSSGYLAASSGAVQLKPGDSYRYQFVNHYNGGDSWLNWHLPVKNPSGTNVLVLRADWYEDINGSTVAEHQRGFSTTDGVNYWNYVPSKMDRVTVDMTVTFTTDKKFVMTSTNTAADNSTWAYNFTSDNGNNVDLTGYDYLTVALSENTAWLELLSEEKTAVGATIGGNGYATFCSKYDLDFTTPISGLTAYKAASATSEAITLEEVTGKVKAGDGIVLKGSAGSYPIPVTTGASTVYTTSETINMWGNTGDTTVEVPVAPSGTNFVLSVQSGDVVFAPVKDKTPVLSPGQAALWADVTVSEARGLRMVFAGDVTGINEAAQAAEAVQKDGKFIENGKLVIVKNGKKYNANGTEIK